MIYPILKFAITHAINIALGKVQMTKRSMPEDKLQYRFDEWLPIKTAHKC